MIRKRDLHQAEASRGASGEVIVMEHVVYRYPSGRNEPGRAIGPLTLRVRRGERVAVIGSNGSGKSTLIHLASGASAPTAGFVRWFGGTPIKEACGRIGVVFQSPALDPLLTVRETFDISGRLLRMHSEHATRRAAVLSRLLGIEDRVDDRIGTLSGGLARRVDLARAVMHEPELLLLDEATAGLDDRSSTSFQDMLDCLSNEGVAIVAATHHPDEIRQAGRVVEMADGCIRSDGSNEKTAVDLAGGENTARQGCVAVRDIGVPADLEAVMPRTRAGGAE